MAQPMHGVYAPVLTPVRPDLSPDVDRWIAHCRWLLENGCDGLAPFGTTSEANSFSVDERIEMMEQLVAAGLPTSKMIVGVGCSAFPDTVRLTRHAVENGAGGVLMLPPFYYKGVSDEGIFRAVAESIERVGDDRLQVYLYHIPPMAVTGFSLRLIERLINAYPDTVVGIKDSSGDLNNLQATLDAFPGFGTFAGTEKFLLQTLRSGGAGTITAMANVIPAEIGNLYAKWQSHEADEIQGSLNAMREATAGMQPICALKEIVAAWLNDPEWRRVRPPLATLSTEKVEALLANPAVRARVAQSA